MRIFGDKDLQKRCFEFGVEEVGVIDGESGGIFL